MITLQEVEKTASLAWSIGCKNWISFAEIDFLLAEAKSLDLETKNPRFYRIADAWLAYIMSHHDGIQLEAPLNKFNDVLKFTVAFDSSYAIDLIDAYLISSLNAIGGREKAGSMIPRAIATVQSADARNALKCLAQELMTT